ncbi:hypothetical protein JI664_12565, partial [Rhodobacter sp. NTK016B]|nr:hypothetical protein [Rhodobacter sp. NTK016B]
MAVAKSLRAILEGSPVDPNHQVVNAELRAKLEEIEAQAALGGTLFFEDELADLPTGTAGDNAFVLDDPTPANNGVYLKGASTWAKTSELPAAFSDAASALAAVDALDASLSPVAKSGDYDDLSNKPTFGTAAAQDVGDFVQTTGAQTIEGVKTFSSAPVVPDNSFAIAKTNGLQAALDAKAPLSSPAFTDTPTAPTAAPGTNTTQLATAAFVQAAIAALLDSAPGTLDTLNELAAALGDDPNFAATIAGQIGDLEAARGFDALIRPVISGTGDAAVATVETEQASISITNGTPFLVRWPAANTVTAPTLTVGATEYTILNQNGGALADGDLGSARWYWMVQHSSSPARLKLIGVVNASELGLGEVDNTRDVDKPVSTAQAATFEAEALVGAR